MSALPSTLEILHPGLLTTVQDLGRVGRRREGMVAAGAMDSLAARVANILVGNRQSDAVLEITLIGPTIRFSVDTVIAVAGADLGAKVDGKPVPLWGAFAVRHGAVLSFGRKQVGTRAYVAVAGGIDVPLVLCSRSTYLRGGIGGHCGRALAAGDTLRAGPVSRNPRRLIGWSAPPDIVDRYTPEALEEPFAVLEGPQMDQFTPYSLRKFIENEFQVSMQSDRMAYRLEGNDLHLVPNVGELLSEPVMVGAIQVPPSGHAMLLMADCQTTGGYPVIGLLAAPEISRAAQLAPGDPLSFRAVELDDAHAALAYQEQLLLAMEWSARLR